MSKLAGSSEVHDLLIKKGRRTTRSKGQIIQTTDGGKSFNLVQSGYVKRYLISNSGSLGVQVIYGPDDIFPITLIYKLLFGHDIDNGPETYYYEAMSNVEVYSFSGDDLLQAVQSQPILYQGLFRESGRRIESMLQGLENMTMSSSYHRVAHQLLYFADKFGKKDAAGVKLLIPLTHQDIADVLNITRETVSNSMTRLSKKGLVKSGRYIIIPSVGKLEAEAFG